MLAFRGEEDLYSRIVNRRALKMTTKARAAGTNQSLRVNFGVLEAAVGSCLLMAGGVPGVPRMNGGGWKSSQSSGTKPGRGNKVTDLEDGRRFLKAWIVPTYQCPSKSRSCFSKLCMTSIDDAPKAIAATVGMPKNKVRGNMPKAVKVCACARKSISKWRSIKLNVESEVDGISCENLLEM